jgi:hypothetical protein
MSHKLRRLTQIIETEGRFGYAGAERVRNPLAGSRVGIAYAVPDGTE